jgi:hypothetical protein
MKFFIVTYYSLHSRNNNAAQESADHKYHDNPNSINEMGQICFIFVFMCILFNFCFFVGAFLDVFYT